MYVSVAVHGCDPSLHTMQAQKREIRVLWTRRHSWFDYISKHKRAISNDIHVLSARNAPPKRTSPYATIHAVLSITSRYFLWTHGGYDKFLFHVSLMNTQLVYVLGVGRLLSNHVYEYTYPATHERTPTQIPENTLVCKRGYGNVSNLVTELNKWT
jgi:hypothetical protein